MTEVTTPTRAFSVGSGEKGPSSWGRILKLSPGILLIGVVFGLPLAWIVRMSLNSSEPGGILVEDWTFENYGHFLTDPFTLALIGRTLGLGVVVTAGAFVLGYPLALFLLRTTSKWKGVLLTLALAPLLTSAVVRTFGWIVILGDRGVINETLLGLGIIEEPLQLVNNELGVAVALIEILMPYMILTVVTGSARLNDTVLEASATLGASRWSTFRRVTIPLTMPGILTGCLLVFVLSISSFVTPALVGGGRVFLLATEIYDQAVATLNWPFAAAISIILIALFGGVLIVYQALMNRLDWDRAR